MAPNGPFIFIIFETLHYFEQKKCPKDVSLYNSLPVAHFCSDMLSTLMSAKGLGTPMVLDVWLALRWRGNPIFDGYKAMLLVESAGIDIFHMGVEF